MTTEMFDVSPAATHSGAKIRKTVTRGLLVAAMTGGLAFGMAMPAFAAPLTGSTTATFSVKSGELSVVVAPTATIATDVATGTLTITGSLDAVTVGDARGGTAPWVLSAVSSVFTVGVEPADITSNSTAVTYSTNAIAKSGGVTALPATAVSILPGVAPIITSSTVSGNNTASFTPTIVVTLPAQALAGTYTGTVTTSVA